MGGTCPEANVDTNERTQPIRMTRDGDFQGALGNPFTHETRTYRTKGYADVVYMRIKEREEPRNARIAEYYVEQGNQ